MIAEFDSVVTVTETIISTSPFDMEWPFDEEPTHVWDDPSHPKYVDWYAFIFDRNGHEITQVTRLNQKTGSYIRRDFDAVQDVAGSTPGPLRIIRRS